MQLVFSYIEHKSQVIPVCFWKENHQLHPLTGYLNDPMGGLNYFAFLDKVLSILRDEDIQQGDISSNSWGVEIHGEHVYFCFLFAQEDTSLHFALSRAVLIDILVLWLAFRSQAPVAGYQEVLSFGEA
ncbi:DUF5376 family protein [Pasteurella multocida]